MSTLQERWDKKLEKSGFKDIEKRGLSGEPRPCVGNDLGSVSPAKVRDSLGQRMLFGQEFYRRAGILASNWPQRWRKTRAQRLAARIWWLFAEDGQSISAITDIIAAEGRPLGRTRVYELLQRYTHILRALPFDTLEDWSGDAVEQLLARKDVAAVVRAILRAPNSKFHHAL